MQITLTTTGRRSGQPRPVTLYAWPDGDGRLILVGSSAGDPVDPAWVGNLRAQPRATIQRGKPRKTTPLEGVEAREVEPGAERDRLWALVCDAFSYYASYQRKTERLIPLFVLTPVDQAD
jgi:deazaflavin-dependent oxidoreductase (nitroreductase family)